MRHVFLYNASAVTAEDANAYAAAQEAQLQQDYAPAYDGDGALDTVRALPTTATDVEAACLALVTAGAIATDERPILLLETMPADAGELGVHGRLPDGRAVCRAFRPLAVQTGDVWSSILSHEALEARANPRLVETIEKANGTLTDFEICDRVQAQSYQKLGVTVSNFNLPSAFAPNADSGTPGAVADAKFDFLGTSTAPDQVQPGGYAQDFAPGTGWSIRGQMTAYQAELDAHGISRPARIRGLRTATE